MTGLKRWPGSDASHPVAKLRELSERLQDRAAAGDLEGLRELLAARQAILDQWILGQGKEGENDRRQLKEILALDAALAGRLQRWQQTLGERLQTLGTGQRLLQGYGRSVTQGPRFVDARR